jgi:hypothetical protein
LLRRCWFWPALLLVAVELASSGCRTHTGQLAGVGGLTGALAGAAIGGSRDNALAGAALGGALGAVGGAAVGEALDETESRARQAAAYQAANGGVGVPQILQMAQAGLGDAVIINHVQTHGLAHPLEVHDLISLRDAGVSNEAVIALQNASTAPTTPVVVSPAPPPVIVHEVQVPGPRVSWGYHHGPRRRNGVSWGFSYWQ